MDTRCNFRVSEVPGYLYACWTEREWSRRASGPTGRQRSGRTTGATGGGEIRRVGGVPGSGVVTERPKGRPSP